MKHCLLSFLALLASAPIFAVADTLVVVQVPAIDAGDAGSACVWDFSRLPDSIYHDMYVLRDTLSPSYAEVQKLGSRYKYSTTTDSLFRLGYENSTTIMRYLHPVPICSFPLRYTDSIMGSYQGEGEYCHLIPLSIRAEYQSVVDGVGELILPDGLRFGCVYRLSVSSSIVENAQDSSRFHVQEYFWFLPNKPYPLVESCEIRSLIGTDTTLYSVAFYTIVEDSALIAHDEHTDNIVDANSSINDVVMTDAHFLPNPVVDNLLVSYHLIRPASVRFTLHSRQGVVLYQSSLFSQQEGDWQMSIPMSGLPTDDYVLYITVDDIILSETIIKL